jgi:hypothetical protein
LKPFYDYNATHDAPQHNDNPRRYERSQDKAKTDEKAEFMGYK